VRAVIYVDTDSLSTRSLLHDSFLQSTTLTPWHGDCALGPVATSFPVRLAVSRGKYHAFSKTSPRKHSDWCFVKSKMSGSYSRQTVDISYAAECSHPKNETLSKHFIRVAFPITRSVVATCNLLNPNFSV